MIKSSFHRTENGLVGVLDEINDSPEGIDFYIKLKPTVSSFSSKKFSVLNQIFKIFILAYDGLSRRF